MGAEELLVVLLLLLVVWVLFVKLLGAAVEVVPMETVPSVVVAFVCLAPNVKSEPVNKQYILEKKDLTHIKKGDSHLDLLFTVVMLAVTATVAGVVLVLPGVTELLLEVLGAAVEFLSMEMLASITAELLCPAPNVKRDPA